MTLTRTENWTGTSSDPNDEQFGDVIETAVPETATDYDAVVVGEPYDGAVIGRTGAADGPAAIRESLAGVKSHHFERGPVSSVGDLGNVAVDADGVAAAQRSVRQVADRIHDLGALPVFLGGDNSLSYANASPLLDRGSLGVVSFDAHLDCREADGEPSSGTPYRQLFEDGLDALAVVGARHFETSTEYADYLDERGGEVVTAETVAADPGGALDAALAAMGGVDQIYVSVDVDVLDAAYPGSSAPTPGGLQPRELFRLVRRVAGRPRVAGFEVVETAPPLDTENRTVDAAARTVAHFLGGHHA
ncbi:formimidoylglutamase [Halobacterium jilantaiense]|uniref:Formimidoylglutamase n=1 Tax=Halobacterium jilantaiense TaxID=355548 RepID=A0A1I0NB57_9EURY|nr:formimidoylglutamase [Halobacterium jilantaiense]SEV98360.1 formiminoglutamase [Halobacterium jilantaiense]